MHPSAFESSSPIRRRSIASACKKSSPSKTTSASSPRSIPSPISTRALQRYPTDVVVLEGQLIAGTIDAIPELVRRHPEAKLIVQVSEADEANTVELYRRGVRGVVPRSISPDLLVKCVRKIAEGETWIDNQSINWVIEAYRSQATSLTSPKSPAQALQKRLAIISCITRGMRNKEIAYQIGTTEQVIKNYLRKVYDKLGVSDRLELALYCLHHELLKKYLVDEPAVPAQSEPMQPLRAKM